MNAKYFQPTTMWWVDLSIILPTPLFFYQKWTNNFYLQLSNNTHYYYYLITLNHINTFFYYILDMTSIRLKTNQLIISSQSLFFDYKVITLTNYKKNIHSLSRINKGSTWLERENKELNYTNYTNLIDSRKLLLNYNYNDESIYYNYNQITNDIYL